MEFTIILDGSHYENDADGMEKLKRVCDEVKKTDVIIHEVHFEDLVDSRTGTFVTRIACIECEGGVLERMALSRRIGLTNWFHDPNGRLFLG